MRLFLAAFIISGFVSPAFAGSETEFSLYGRSAGVAQSGVSGSDPGGAGTFSFSAGWDLSSATGFRVTWWQGEDYGWGVDFNNAGAIADGQTLAGNGLNSLALENGLSLLTVNAYRRWHDSIAGATPYVGAGVGLAMPHVRFDGGGTPTNSRQLTGPTVQVVAGARYPLGNQMSVFGEYQGNYFVNMAGLGSGGTLSTNILTSGLNFGVSLGF